MSRVRTEEGKRTFYRNVYVHQFNDGVNGRKRLYLGADGKLTSNPALAFMGVLPPQRVQGLKPYQMPILLTGKSSKGIPSIRQDFNYFVMLCLGRLQQPDGSAKLSYYAPHGIVTKAEEAYIFPDQQEAYDLGATLFPQAVAVQEGRNFPYGQVSYVGVTLDNFSGMEVVNGVWVPVRNTRR